jgi:hypothetical protein
MAEVDMDKLGALYRLEAAGKLPPEHQAALDRLRERKALPAYQIGLDDPTFGQAEERYGLPPGMLRAVGGVESSGRSDAVSPTGVTGVMQVTLGTGKPYGLTKLNRTNPYLDIDVAARHLADLMDRSGGDVKKAVALYGDQNEPGYAGKVMKRWAKLDIGTPGEGGDTAAAPVPSKLRLPAEKVAQIAADRPSLADQPPPDTQAAVDTQGPQPVSAPGVPGEAMAAAPPDTPPAIVPGQSTTTTPTTSSMEPGADLGSVRPSTQPQQKKGNYYLPATAARTIFPVLGTAVGAVATPFVGPEAIPIASAAGAAVGDWIAQGDEMEVGTRTAYNPYRTMAEAGSAGFLSNWSAGKTLVKAMATGAIGNVGSDTVINLSEGKGLPAPFELAMTAIGGAMFGGVAHVGGELWATKNKAIKEITGSDTNAAGIANLTSTPAEETTAAAVKKASGTTFGDTEAPMGYRFPEPAADQPKVKGRKGKKPQLPKMDTETAKALGFEDADEADTLRRALTDPPPDKSADMNLGTSSKTNPQHIADTSDEAASWDDLQIKAQGRKQDLVPPLDKDQTFDDVSSWTRGWGKVMRPKDVFIRMENETGLPIYRDYAALHSAYVDQHHEISDLSRGAVEAFDGLSPADRGQIVMHFQGDQTELSAKLAPRAEKLRGVLDRALEPFGMTTEDYFSMANRVAKGESVDEILANGAPPDAIAKNVQRLADEMNNGQLSGRDPSLIRISGRIIEMGTYEKHLADLAEATIDKYKSLPSLSKESREFVKGYLNNYVNVMKGSGWDPSAKTISSMFQAVSDKLGLGWDGKDMANKLIQNSYAGLIGLRPSAMIRNAMQNIQTGIPIYGRKAFVMGFKDAFSEEGRALARAKGIIGVENALMAETSAAGHMSWAQRAMAPYQTVEDMNRTVAYLSGRHRFDAGLAAVEGLGEVRNNANWEKLLDKADIDMLSIPEQKVLAQMWDHGESIEDIRHAYAKGIVDDTQFMYLPAERAQALQTMQGRMMLGFANWGQSYASYLARLIGAGPQGKRMGRQLSFLGTNAALLGAYSLAGSELGDKNAIKHNAGWTFAGPLMYSGGPIGQSLMSVEQAVQHGYEGDFNRAKGDIASIPLKFIPGGMMLKDVYDAAQEPSASEMFGRMLGFKRGKVGNQGGKNIWAR